MLTKDDCYHGAVSLVFVYWVDSTKFGSPGVSLAYKACKPTAQGVGLDFS